MKNWSLFLTALLVCVCTNFYCVAQDTVSIQKDDGKITKRTGSIVDWNRFEIVLKSSNGRQRKIAAKDILKVQTTWPEEYTVAQGMLTKNQFRPAIEKLELAVKAERRKWAKRIITSELVRTLDSVENPSAAIGQFLQIYADDPETQFFNLIPLSWSVPGIKPPPVELTNKWLGSKNGVLRLLGASWQLATNREKAIASLEELIDDPDKRIVQLASTQLWRARVLTANATDVERWELQIEKLIPELRAGPLTVLADAQYRNGDKKRAQINLMKIPILYPENKSLAAFALFRCGEIIDDNAEQDVAKDKAKTVWRELIQHYPASQFAGFAAAKMKE